MSRDRQYNRLIHTGRWLRLRRDMLTAHPLCQRCEEEGRINAASEVHHVTPVETGLTPSDKERLMFNPTNLLALCHDCHVKVHTEMGRSGKVATQQRTQEHLAKFAERFLGAPPGGDFKSGVGAG